MNKKNLFVTEYLFENVHHQFTVVQDDLHGRHGTAHFKRNDGTLDTEHLGRVLEVTVDMIGKEFFR